MHTLTSLRGFDDEDVVVRLQGMRGITLPGNNHVVYRHGDAMQFFPEPFLYNVVQAGIFGNFFDLVIDGDLHSC